MKLKPIKGTYIITRSCTHTYVGRVVCITKSWIVLDNAAWMADSGVWSEMLAKGDLKEAAVEAYPVDDQVRVSRKAVVEVTPWAHGPLKTIIY